MLHKIASALMVIGGVLFVAAGVVRASEDGGFQLFYAGMALAMIAFGILFLRLGAAKHSK